MSDPKFVKGVLKMRDLKESINKVEEENLDTMVVVSVNGVIRPLACSCLMTTEDGERFQLLGDIDAAHKAWNTPILQ